MTQTTQFDPIGAALYTLPLNDRQYHAACAAFRMLRNMRPTGRSRRLGAAKGAAPLAPRAFGQLTARPVRRMSRSSMCRRARRLRHRVRVLHRSA